MFTFPSEEDPVLTLLLLGHVISATRDEYDNIVLLYSDGRRLTIMSDTDLILREENLPIC